MKVMVIVKASKASEAGEMPDTELLAAMGNYNEELVKAGIMLAGEGLHPTSKGKRVRFSGKSRTVIDGPFTETKELIAGYWLWRVKDMDEAVAWLKRCPNPHNETTEVEIRPVFEADDFGEAFTPELREQEQRILAAAEANAAAATPPEKEVRAVVDTWLDAIRRHDLDAVIENHTDTLLMFDVPEPVAVRGLAAYRRTWPPFFRWLRDGNGTFEPVEVTVTAGESVAFVTALLKCGTSDEMSKDASARLRLSLGLQRIDGRWKIAHEHHSFPAAV